MEVDGLPVRIASTPRMPPTHSAESPGHGLARWFAEEVQPHEPALRAYLRARFPAVGDHDDLVQETYARLLRAREQGRLTYAKAFLGFFIQFANGDAGHCYTLMLSMMAL